MQVIKMDFPLRVLQPFLGARIIKTGVAVFLTLALLHWFGSAYATFGAVAAVLAVQPTLSQAHEVFREQLLGNAVAGLVATLLGLWLPVNPLTMALASVLVLGLLVRLRLPDAAGLAVVVVLFVMDRPEQDFLAYTLARMGVIAAGMAVGYVVNRLIHPPDALGRAKAEIAAGNGKVERFLERLVRSLGSPQDYTKEEIKADAVAAQAHLSAARSTLDLDTREVRQLRAALLKQANNSLFVFVEAITDIHKLILEAGGLPHGPERELLTAVLRALQAYRASVMDRVLNEGPGDPDAARRYQEALAAFSRRVEGLIDHRDRREFGLQLHLVLAEIRHMGWRIDALARLCEQA